MPAVIVLPKIRPVDGQFRMTAIEQSAITGLEPCKVTYGGKTMTGTKVYTKTGWFKVFASPDEMLTHWTAKLEHGSITAQPLLTAGNQKISGLQKVKALPHAIKS